MYVAICCIDSQGTNSAHGQFIRYHQDYMKYACSSANMIALDIEDSPSEVMPASCQRHYGPQPGASAFWLSSFTERCEFLRYEDALDLSGSSLDFGMLSELVELKELEKLVP